MENMDAKSDFETLHHHWYLCFEYMLKSFKAGFTSKAIKSLFYNFDMENWQALWLQSTRYKDNTKPELIEFFAGECFYISDRYSYDRIFRAHWLFRKAFEKELYKIKYPNYSYGE